MLRLALAIFVIVLAGCSSPADQSDTSQPITPTSSTPATTTQTSSSTPPSSSPAMSSVTIQNFAFAPKSHNVNSGDTVTWTNMDSASHTVTSDAGAPASFDSGSKGNSGTFSFTFTTAGTYAYHCKIHPSMTGTVTVA